MYRILNDLKSEILQFFSGKTLEALLPPLIFLAAIRFMPLIWSSSLTLLLSSLMLSMNIIKKTPMVYALTGFIGVLISIAFTILSGSSKGYFLPDILMSLILIITSITSLIVKKPLAAWMSHLTRGWPIQWFWRDDIRPAYREVTLLWLLFLTLRFSLLVAVYLTSTVEQVFLTNTLLGGPATILVLSVSYVYGILRLGNLQGPSVNEFIEGVPKPWGGQRRGF